MIGSVFYPCFSLIKMSSLAVNLFGERHYCPGTAKKKAVLKHKIKLIFRFL
jgi:hypothetical protein